MVVPTIGLRDLHRRILKFRSQAQRRIHEPNCKDCLTVFRLGGAILPGEGEHLPAIDRRIGEIPDLKLLEAAPRHSLCAGLMTRRLNFVPRTVNLTIRKLNLTVLRTEDLMLGE